MVLPKLPGYRAGRGHLPVMAGGAEGNGGQEQVGDGRGEPADQPGDVRAALLRPDVLAAGEHAVAAHTPAPDDDLLAAELAVVC